MRSRTSRGVLEWSGGKENYIGSAVLAIEKVSGSPGIVLGPPEGSRGSTGWGHLSRRAPWAEVGGEPAPSGLVRSLPCPPAPRVGNPRWGGRTTCLGGPSTPLGHRPLGRLHLLGPAPPLGGLYKGGQGGGQPHSSLCASLPLLHLVLLPQQLGEALPEFCCIHHHAVVLVDLYQPLLPPCWIKKEEMSC